MTLTNQDLDRRHAGRAADHSAEQQRRHQHRHAARAYGGTLELRGLFTNVGGTLYARNGSVLQLSNATVVGGTLTSSKVGALRTRPGTIGQLDSVTLNGTYVAGDGTSNTTTRLVNTINNNGTLAMNSGVGGGLTTSLVLYAVRRHARRQWHAGDGQQHRQRHQ